MHRLQRLGNVYFLKVEKGSKEWIDPSCKDLRYLTLICFSLYPNPELVWPDNQYHRDEMRRQITAFRNLGLFDTKILKEVEGHDHCISVAAQVPNLVVAHRIFEELKNVAVISDIYLYDNGVLVVKHD